MQILPIFLLPLLILGADSTSTVAPINSTVAPSTVAPSSTVAPISSTVGDQSTVTQPTTTVPPLVLSTFAFDNDVKFQDAQLILQKATLLNNQILSLNSQLLQSQRDVDPSSSPLFSQLGEIAHQLDVANATLQSQLAQLVQLQSQQSQIDSRVTVAEQRFTCFAASQCVTPVPTTAAPTTPAATREPATCSLSNVTATRDTPATLHLNESYNANCQFSISAQNPTDKIHISIDLTILENGYLQVIEPRTGNIVGVFNATTTQSAAVNVTTSAIVIYYADATSSIAFSLNYTAYSTCSLECANGGTCLVSQSGAEYCQCPCMFSGTTCETFSDPCKAKQKKLCGQIATDAYGVCYINACFDSCYACACIKNSTSSQKCETPDEDKPWTAPTSPANVTTCPTTTTFAPSTVAASTVGPTTTEESGVEDDFLLSL